MNYIKSERENILLVHLAPTCGTCSAARSKRHKSLEAAGYHLPKPLRSKEYPMGLPSLGGLDAAKVTSANALYEVTFQIASSCIDLQLTVSIENPENSLFGDAVPIQGPLAKCNGHHNVFQSWMIGGDRGKQTKWWCSDSDEAFSTFDIMRDKSHDRKAWTRLLHQKVFVFPPRKRRPIFYYNARESRVW